MSDKIVRGGLSAALVDHDIAEVSLYNAAKGRTQRVAVEDLRRFCEDVLRVIDRHEKEKRSLERLAKRLYETELPMERAIVWANLPLLERNAFIERARRFRGAK